VREFAYGMLELSMLLIPLGSIAYLIWSGIRGFRPAIKFDAVWAMALSWPGLFAPFVAWSVAPWASIPLALALAGCWALACWALRGRPVPLWFAWVPLTVMACTAAAYTLTGGYWGFLFATYLGVGLVAWVAVSLSAGFSIRAAARETHPSVGPAKVPIGVEAS